jgi:hypothetical protein
MKTASVVFFYFGEESYLTALAQETVALEKALQGYDHTVVLKHADIDAGPFKLKQKVEQSADVLELPTKENLVAQLNRLGDAGYLVDLYIFSHGWTNCFRVSTGSYGQNTTVNATYLRNNVKPLKLRMVWQCNCYGATLNPLWQELGAEVSAGSRFVNFYPTRFSGFVDRWQRGEAFVDCITKSDTALVRTPAQTYILADALSKRASWGGCQIGQTVLGDSPCAASYFKKNWLGEDWQPELSGKQNMNYASEMLILGNAQLRRV